MDRAVMVASFTVLVEIVSCSVVGLTYMDSLNLVPSGPAAKGQDPCKPLYWYPRQIPDYCYFPKNIPSPPARPVPVPPPPPPNLLPMPVPPMPMLPPPMPLPMPMPMFLPMPAPPPISPPLPGIIPIPAYGAPAPFPVGAPGALLPGQPVPAMQTGLVPGVDGLVSPQGAINILPFSDAYSDLLEKHKQKMIRRRLQNLLDEYEHYPRKRRSRRKHRYIH